MPRRDDKSYLIILMLEEIVNTYISQMTLVLSAFVKIQERKRKRCERARSYSMLKKIPAQVKHLNRLALLSDTDCITNLRMDRNAFGRLCLLLKQLGGLRDNRYVSVEEQVAIFVGVIAHHKNNRLVGFDFQRSGYTISHYVHVVLRAILKIHGTFMLKPLPVEDDCQDATWKWFKGCLGALDGTYIHLHVHNSDKPRFRSHKGQICTNTLAACDRFLRFVYVLPGWEGSASDGRVLQDAINRINGLKVPDGNYYLCDNAYTNSNGFLTQYKDVRYHLKEWGPQCVQPQSRNELFNMRHSKARNVIERAFGVLKMRWGILQSASHYPLKTQIRLIMACILLHNFIRGEMDVDPFEEMIDNIGVQVVEEDEDEHHDFVDADENFEQWNEKRDEIAQAMWEEFNLEA